MDLTDPDIDDTIDSKSNKCIVKTSKEYYDLIQSDENEQHKILNVFQEDSDTLADETNNKPFVKVDPLFIDNAQKKSWDYSNTHMLIELVRDHENDLSHPKKKRHVFTNISKIMNAEDINVTSTECYRKWQNLIRTYKKVKKDERKSSRFSFFDKMEEIVGKKFRINNETEIDEANVTLEPEGANDIINDRIKRKDIKKHMGFKNSYYAAKMEKLKLKTERWDRMESLIKKKLELEERKVVALEKLVSLKQ